MSFNQIRQAFEFIGGLGMFLYGMKVMSDGLQRAAGNRMKRLFSFITKNPLSGILSGLLLTSVIQSSSAATVMVVGFVNAGFLSLSQSVGIIMGANIGTTITAWMVSMREWAQVLRPEFFAPVLLGIGAFLLLLTQKKRPQTVGSVLVGFGLLFIGLSFMSGSIAPYQDSPVFAKLFTFLGKNPLLGLLVGMAVTALVQSSSASMGILQTLAMNGIVTFRCAVYLTLGQNIGTCMTALLASLTAGQTARQAALIHLLFNVIGTACFGTAMFFLFAADPHWAGAAISGTQISVFHTVFNLGTTLLLFPFTEKLVKLSEKLIR
ncbi:MAG: Na/Pi cotransporter family protein [Lachnospiraceae bacterium]|jgi:phosphate:Na+ symporter|nr:Na/Pi cotransporter family protein [Lachnospiraceae bacterium]